jgi:DNA helicase-2/ATP-dependent DNA helicase PcrA
VTAAPEVEEWIDDSGLVSEQQRQAVRATGNFFLLSRPGSGKTRTVGIRVARLAAQASPIRVAATSYTNVAIRQIEATVRERGVVLDSRHFTGTIHQFLLQYVVYPFGHLLGIKQPLNLIMDEKWSGWPAVIYEEDVKKRLPVGALHYTASASFAVHKRPTIGVTRQDAEIAEVDQVRKKKQEARRRGLVSGSDAMYYAQKILTEHPVVCAAVAGRFDELIVDEAQDTSDVQLKCLELLRSSGKLRSLVLVGDLDQSIFSFQGARPLLCQELVDRCELTRMPLTENFRSSQAICNVTCRFCRRTDPDEAVGENKNCEISPEIFLYDHVNPHSAVEVYQARLAAHEIAESGAVVLTRGRKFRDEINGIEHVEGLHRFVTALGRLGAARQEKQTIDRDQLRTAERALSELAWGEDALVDDSERHRAVRRALMRLLRELPDFDRTLPDWIAQAREKVKTTLTDLTDKPKNKPQYLLKSKAAFNTLRAADVLLTRPSSLLARTVHDVKGESHESVLLVVQPRHGPSDQAGLWSAPLLGEAVEEEQEEEPRIAYVALTRAERYCAIALPTNVEAERIDAYLGVGFVRVAAS